MIALNIPLLTWCVIAFMMVALIVVRVCYKNYNQAGGHRHLIEIGEEVEEFFIPGDIVEIDEKVYDDEE